MKNNVVDDICAGLMALSNGVAQAKEVASLDATNKVATLDKKLTDALNAYKTKTDARLTALEKK